MRRTLADGPLPLLSPIFAEAVGLLDRTEQKLLALPVLREAEPQYPRAEARIVRSMLFHRLLNAMARATNPLQEEWIARRDAAGDDPEKQLAVADALWVLQQKYEA